MAINNKRLKSKYSPDKQLFSGYIIIGLFILSILIWGVFTKIDSYAMGSGKLITFGNQKIIQSSEKGIISDIPIKVGMHVTAGEVLLRLDNEEINSNINSLRKQISQYLFRYKALGGAVNENILKDEFLPDSEFTILSEIDSANAQTSLYRSKIAQVNNQIMQLKIQINGNISKVASLKKQLNIASKNVDSLRQVYDEGYASYSRVTQAESDKENITIKINELNIENQVANDKIAEMNNLIQQIINEKKQTKSDELSNLSIKINELYKNYLGAKLHLKRLEIRSPVSGNIQSLSVANIGRVVAPNEALLVIVPDDEELIAEVKISSREVNFFKNGDNATIKLVSFVGSVPPEVPAKITFVSPDVEIDSKSNMEYYLVRLKIDKTSLDEKIQMSLRPGLPVMAMKSTGRRSAIEYFLRPMNERLSFLFKE